MGMDAMTGRGYGFCAGYGMPGYVNTGQAAEQAGIREDSAIVFFATGVQIGRWSGGNVATDQNIGRGKGNTSLRARVNSLQAELNQLQARLDEMAP